MGITALFTALTKGGNTLEGTEENISSLIDSWILLRDVEQNGERNRCLHIMKSRGMAHSNQLREFLMTGDGIKLLPVYVGAGQVLAGSSRLAQEARDQAEAVARKNEVDRKREVLESKRRALQAKIESMQAELAAEEQQMERTFEQERQQEQRLELDREEMAASRKVDSKQDERAESARGGR
jgi:circadian clock protein KaiC